MSSRKKIFDSTVYFVCFWYSYTAIELVPFLLTSFLLSKIFDSYILSHSHCVADAAVFQNVRFVKFKRPKHRIIFMLPVGNNHRTKVFFNGKIELIIQINIDCDICTCERKFVKWQKMNRPKTDCKFKETQNITPKIVENYYKSHDHREHI